MKSDYTVKPKGCICFGEFPVINCPVHGLCGGGAPQEYVDGLKDAATELVLKQQMEIQMLRREKYYMQQLLWLLVHWQGGKAEVDFMNLPMRINLSFEPSKTDPGTIIIKAKS